MKYFFIDEIIESDLNRIEEFLKQNADSSSLEKLFWIDIPDCHLSKEQLDQDKQKPYVFSIECGKDWIKAELFIRSLGDFKGIHQEYCTPSQRDFIIGYTEGVINDLGIGT